MEQIILVCDDNGNFTGKYILKRAGHQGKGQRHLAITVLLFNSKGEVLLQKRKHQIFDDIWDFTGATHPFHKEDGSDETFEEATLRCLKREYNIEQGQVANMRNLGAFNYFAAYDNGLCENEHCAMLVGEYNYEVNVNPDVGYGYKWMKKEDFFNDIKDNPQNYSPWSIRGVEILFTTEALL